MKILEEAPQLKFKNNVVIYDDIMFLHQKDEAQHQFQVLMGEKRLPIDSIRNFKENIAYNLINAKREGVKYKHIVFPCKPIIYQKSFKKIGISLTPMFSDEHKHPDVLYADFLNESDYYKTDSHINDFGTLKVVNKVLQEFGYPRLPEALFENRDMHTDLKKMIGDNSKDNVESIIGLKNLPKTTIEKFAIAKEVLGGNTGEFKFRFNPYALHNKRVILFGDSFFSNQLNVYQYIFSEVFYFRVPYIIDDIMRILEPDITLTANTERYLFNVPSVNKPKPWFMNYINNRFDSKSIPDSTIDAFTALFSGRSSSAYLDRFGRRLVSLPRDQDSLSKLDISDITSSNEVNYLRDYAVGIEKNNLELAYYLMSLAHQARPNGKLIEKKLLSYKEMLNYI